MKQGIYLPLISSYEKNLFENIPRETPKEKS